MEFVKYVLMVLVVLSGFMVCSSEAYTFYVVGGDGWVLNPSESYNHWAGRNRFQVNDTLYFKYKKGSDSVLVVNKDDYYSCKKDHPIIRMDDGDSIFKFNSSGPFFFISGNNGSCEKNQKLIVIVLAVRPHPIPTHQAPPPALPKPISPAETPTPATNPSSPESYPAISPSPKGPTPMSPATSPTPTVIPRSPESSPGISPSPSPVYSLAPTGPTPISPVTTSAPTLAPISPSPQLPTPEVSPPPVGTPMNTPAITPPMPPTPSSSDTTAPPAPAPAPSSSNVLLPLLSQMMVWLWVTLSIFAFCLD